MRKRFQESANLKTVEAKKHEEDIEKWTFDKTDEEEEGGQQTRACVVIWIFCEFQTEDTQAASSKQAAQLSFSNRSRGGREIAGARGVVYCLKYKVHNYT